MNNFYLLYHGESLMDVEDLGCIGVNEAGIISAEYIYNRILNVDLNSITITFLTSKGET